jgi:hypothetical protein
MFRLFLRGRDSHRAAGYAETGRAVLKVKQIHRVCSSHGFDLFVHALMIDLPFAFVFV